MRRYPLFLKRCRAISLFDWAHRRKGCLRASRYKSLQDFRYACTLDICFAFDMPCGARGDLYLSHPCRLCRHIEFPVGKYIENRIAVYIEFLQGKNISSAVKHKYILLCEQRIRFGASRLLQLALQRSQEQPALASLESKLSDSLRLVIECCKAHICSRFSTYPC